MKGDTASAYATLLQAMDPQSLSALCRLALNLHDRVLAESLLSVLPNDIDSIADLKARAALLFRDPALARSALPDIQDPILRVRVWLQTGNPVAALRVLDSLQAQGISQDSLRIQAYLQSGHPLLAWQLWRRKITPRRLSLALARALDASGAYREAQIIWHDLWHNPGQGRDWVPKEQSGIALLTDLYRTGQASTPVADTLQTALSGVLDLPMPSASPTEIQSVLIDLAKGTPLSVGLQRLLDLGAYATVFQLLEGVPRDAAIRSFLLQAHLLAFQDTHDSAHLDSARLLFQAGISDPWARAMAIRWLTPESLPAVDPAPLTPEQRVQYIRWLIETGNAASAIPLFRQFKDLAADSHLVFQTFLAAGWTDSAYRYLNFERSDEVLAMAEALWQQQHPDLVLPLVRKIQKPGFDLDRKARKLEVLALDALAQRSDLIPLAETVLRTYGPDPELQKVLAKAWLHRDPWRALKWAFTVDDSVAYSVRARALFALGHPGWAGRYAEYDSRVRFALALQAQDLEALQEIPLPMDSVLVESYLKLLEQYGDTLRVQSIAKILVQERWATPDYFQRIRAEVWITQGHKSRAKDVLARLQDPEQKAKLQYALGVALMKAGALDSAKSLFFKTIQWGSPETRGYAAFKLASILFQEGRYQEAREYYQMALDLVPEDSVLRLNALHNLAVCQKRLKDLEGARKAYLRLIEEFPASEDAIDARYSLGLLLLDLSEPEKAYQTLQGIEGEMPKPDQEAELQYWLGQAAAQSGNLEAALQHFRRLYLFHPQAGQWVTTAQAEAAKLFVATGQIEKAKALYQILLRTLPVGDPLRQQLQQEYEQLQRLSSVPSPSSE